MLPNRIYISKETENRLKHLKQKTGLTPNLLARMAFCFSLNQESVPDSVKHAERGQEFTLPTLTGEYNEFFLALLRERLVIDNLDIEENLVDQFKAHIQRGAVALNQRIDSLEDIATVVAEINT